MPIIASQHSWKDKYHTPLDSWPDDCTVQWGGRGMVLSDTPGGGYQTAFFEAFPKDGGFIRGEGKSIADAEKNAFEKFVKISACTHAWSRKGYTNGGAICRNCGAFQTMFKPILKLGSWKEPLSPSSLDLVAEGVMRPCPDDPRQHRYRRRSWLKARHMGIDLPDFETAPEEPDGFDEDDYAKFSRRAVQKFLRENPEILEQDRDGRGMSGLFEGLHITSLKRLAEEDIEEDGLEI